MKILCIEKSGIDKIRSIMSRLYEENSLNGDDMRNMAQALDSATEDVWEYVDEETLTVKIINRNGGTEPGELIKFNNEEIIVGM
jgi:hypothetical protein